MNITITSFHPSEQRLTAMTGHLCLHVEKTPRSHLPHLRTPSNLRAKPSMQPFVLYPHACPTTIIPAFKST